MSLRLRACAVAFCLLAPSPHVSAQQPQPSAPAAQPGAKKSPARAAAVDPLAAGRRATAVNLLGSLADEARGFRDSTLRSRIQAQAADALWGADQERARALFRRAWDAAEQADADNTRRRQAELNAPRTGTPGGSGGGPNQRMETESRGGGGPGRAGGLATTLNLPQMRSEVLRLVARRDRALGEEFLAKLEDARKQDERTLAADSVAGAAAAPAPPDAGAAGDTESAAPRPRNPHETPPDDARRLRLASQLLNEGDAEQALQFADPALRRGINVAVVEFLVNLREKAPEAADQRFLALLARAGVDPATNANAVLFISSYVLTPHMYMTIEPGGGISTSQRGGIIRTPDLPAPLRAAFANFAAQILARPLPPSEGSAGGVDRASIYFVAGRLLPFIEQVAPARAAALRAQLAAITPDVPQAMRDDMQDDMRRGFVPEGQRNDERLQQALDSASTSTDPRRRDAAYLQAALIAARREDPKARDYAAKIEDADLRRQALAFVDFSLLSHAIRKSDGAEVLRLAQTGELTQTQRAWALAEASRLLLKDDRPRAVEALEAAFEAAKKIDAEDSDRPRALVAVATRYAPLDRNRAWELLAEAVKAANAAPDFTGADAGMAARVQTGGMSSTTNFPAPSFDLEGVFTALAREDMNRAVALAQTFTHESPRAVATLAVARAVLEDNAAPAPRPNRAANPQ